MNSSSHGNTFTVTVEQYDNTKDLYIEIPHYILQYLVWEEGDILDWQIQEDNSIKIVKVENPSTLKNANKSKKQYRHANLNALDEKPTLSDYDWYTVKEEAIEEYLNSESEGKDYSKDPDKFYEENYLRATNEETFGAQSIELQKDRPLPPPSNFPHFP